MLRRDVKNRGWAVLEIILGVFLVSQAFAQTPGWSCRISKPPDPYKFAKENLERLMWIEIKNKEKEPISVRLHGEIKKDGKLVARANSNKVDIPPGGKRITRKDITKLTDEWWDKKLEKTLLRAPGLPEGKYEICVYIYKWNSRELLTKCCISIISKPRISPPKLLFPKDGTTLPEREKHPFFRWTPPTPTPPKVTYELKIVEVKPGQTEEEALRLNPPLFEKSGITATQFRYPAQARRLDTDKKYVWKVEASFEDQAIASAEWGFSRAKFKPVLKKLTPINLKVTREVVRHGNWYQVILNLTNKGSKDISYIVVRDSNKYFQCIDDAAAQKLPPPGSPWMFELPEHAPCSVYSVAGGFSSVIEIGPFAGILEPGRTIVLKYSVVPLLTFSITGPGHILGAGLKVTYKEPMQLLPGEQPGITYKVPGQQHSVEFPHLAVKDVPDLGDAWRAADYMIVTCPARLQGSKGNIDELLVAMANLAKSKSGALLYLTGGPTSAVIVRNITKALGTVLKSNWHNGYLLIVGEDDIIPTWTAPSEVFGDGTIAAHLVDLPYADWNDDLAPNLQIGRIIGPTASDLVIPIKQSLAIMRHSGCSYDASNALFLSGPERCWEIFVEDMHEGAEYANLHNGVNTSALHTEFITTRRKIAADALWIIGKDAGGAHPDSSLSTFTTEQLCAWLIEIKQGLPSPGPGDQPFQDTEGRPRRVPGGWSEYTLLTKASAIAAPIEHARRGVTYGTYYYSHDEDWNKVKQDIRFVLKPRVQNHDLIVWVGHSGAEGWGSVLEKPSQVQDLGFSSGNTRPIVIAFGCHSGDYDHTNSISRAFLKYGVACYVGSSENMFPTGDDVLKFRFWDNWNKQMAIGDALKQLKRNMKLTLPMDKYLRLFLREINLYGDPKFGGKP